MGTVGSKFRINFIIALFILGCSNNASFKKSTATEINSTNGQVTTAPPPVIVKGEPYLRLHPENPRYFIDNATGEPVLIASYSFDNLVPSSRRFDYVADLKRMKDNGVTYTRVWHLLPWEKTNSIWPWARSATPGARVGSNKYDLTKWNEEYWARLRDGLRIAKEYGIACEIMIFDKSSMSSDTSENNRWGGNPWNPANNINGIEMAANKIDAFPEFYEYDKRPTLRGLQEAFVKKMIDETIQYNVIYEIENEHIQNGTAFGNYWGQFVKNYIKEMYPKNPRLVAYNSLEKDLDSFYSSPHVDIINQHPSAETGRYPYYLATYIESHWNSGKPINIDEYGNGESDIRKLRWPAWTIVTSGGNFHIENDYLPANSQEISKNIQAFLKATKWDFIHAVPNRHRSFSGFCMVQENVEYVCYYNKGGSKRIDLPQGNYQVQWWNTRSGGFTEALYIQHAGGTFSTNTPDAEDWVLYIKSRASVARGSTVPPRGNSCAQFGYDSKLFDLVCPKTGSSFSNDVQWAIETAISRYPELFNFNDSKCFNCYFIKDPDLYHWYITEILGEKGYCVGYDGDEIGVKNSNSFSEMHDIILSSGHVRYNNSYTTTCKPPQTVEGPRQ